VSSGGRSTSTKCIPYFAEAASCGICIVECPWMRRSALPTLCALQWLEESL
jgi:hypothetical protein